MTDTLPMKISSKDIRLKYDNGINFTGESNDQNFNYGKPSFESTKGLRTILTQN